MFKREVNQFQRRLKELRIKKGYTQKALGDRTGIDGAYISKLENGEKENPSYKILLRLCRALDCSFNELTGQ